MQTIFSTRDVPQHARFEYFQEVACKNIAGHESTPVSRIDFEATLSLASLADLPVLLSENSAMRVTRATPQIAQAATDDVFIFRQNRGRVAMEQDGREFIVGGGDFGLLETQLPYFANFATQSELLLVKVPRSALESRLGNIRAFIARGIKPSPGDAGLASSFLAALPTHVGSLSAKTQQLVREQLLDLVSASLCVGMDRKPRLSSARAVAAVKVKAAIESRLTDPALDAEGVARAAGVSVRYANAVLSWEGESIMRRIQMRRLARCKQAIGDPLQAHRSLTEIAYDWGFSDMTHFSRRFRAAYGMLPREYRRSIAEGNEVDR